MRVLVVATSKSARGDRGRIAPGRHDALDHLAVTRYDIAVLDRDRPGVHGDEVCRRLAAERVAEPDPDADGRRLDRYRVDVRAPPRRDCALTQVEG
jgi:CheY-like chemotaxis protein